MQRLVLLLMLVFSPVVYGQKKKQPLIRYKTIYDNTFSIGDRIDMGEIEVVLLPLGKDSIVIPDSLDMYRDFIQNNRFIAFKLHMNWKLQGVKYPGRTDRTRDALLTYLNDDGTEQDSVCDINYFKHTFVKKQVPVLRIELEVIDVKAPNMHGTVINGVIGLPEMNVLYRNYDNLIDVAVGGIHDSYWIEGHGVSLTVEEGDRGLFVGRPAGTGKTASIAIKSVNGQDTVTLVTHQYRIINLPQPSIYLGTIPIDQITTCSEDDFRTMTRFFAKYPPEIPLKVYFQISVYSIVIGSQEILVSGKDLPEAYKTAYENAEKGTEIVFTAFKVTGPDQFMIDQTFKRIKQSEKGTKYIEPTYDAKCEG